MDLNHLFHREGEERLRAHRAACDQSRAVHVALAEAFRDRIDIRRRTTAWAGRSRPGIRRPEG